MSIVEAERPAGVPVSVSVEIGGREITFETGKLAKQSDGAFHINSELGSGTVAELWLPRAPGVAETVEPTPSEERRDHSSRRLEILLVDDHPEVRSTTAALLSDAGHAVTEASNGAEALALLDIGRTRFDLMITDYAMPHLSGTEFLRETRARHRAVPALIITGYAETDAVSDRPEGVEILLKPFTPRQLQDAVERACSASVEKGATATPAAPALAARP